MITTPTLWRAAQQANTTDSGVGGNDQTIPQLVALANGNFVALWESNTNTGAGSASGTDIIGQLYSAEGAKIGTEFRANNSFTADDEGDFTAAALPNGNFVVAFEDIDSNGTAIRFTVLGSTGAPLSSGTIQSDSNGDDLGGPSITANLDGSFLVAFQRRVAGADQTQTQGVIVGGNGVVGEAFPLAAASSSNDVGANGQQVATATLTNGNYVIVNRDDGADPGLSMRIVTATGANVLGLRGVANTLANGDTDLAPAIAALSGGGYVVAWQNTDATDTDVEFQRFDAAGNAVGSLGTVNSSGTDNNRVPKLVGLSDGGFVIIYDDNEANKIALQRYSSTGAEVGAEVTVATTSSPGANLSQPTVSLTDDGRLLVGWTSTIQTFDPVGFDNDVRFAIFDPRETVITGDGSANVITSRKDGATVNGLGGADTLLGQEAADTLNGGDGNDTIHGRGGADLIQGGLNQDTIFGDEGNDTIYANTQDNPNGSTVGDTISGGAGEDTLVGSAGNDQLNGDTDNDVLNGGAGADVLNGGAGADRLTGGAGNDSFIVDNTGDRVFEASGDGTDRVFASTSYALQAGQEIEGLQLLAATGSVNLNLTGNEISQSLVGNNGNNVLDGGIGADAMTGRGGNDTYLVDNLGDRVAEAAGGGTDTVLTRASYALGAGQEIEALQLLTVTGTARLNLNGNEFGQSLVGNNGANVLDGKGGADVLTGRGGADSFLFSTALSTTNVDWITDFAAEDTIRLSKSVFAALAPGQLAGSAFKNLSAGTADADDRILYKRTTGELFYDTDGSGSGATVRFALIDNKAALAAADFFVV